jgi:hypothetical protein
LAGSGAVVASGAGGVVASTARTGACWLGAPDGFGSAAVVAADVGVSAAAVDDAVGVGVGDGVVSLVVVVGAAVAGGATNPRAVVAMASVAKAARSRLRLSPMDIPFFVLLLMHPYGAELSIIHRLEN